DSARRSWPPCATPRSGLPSSGWASGAVTSGRSHRDPIIKGLELVTAAGLPPVPGSDPGAVHLGRLQVVSDAALAYLDHDRLLDELLARTAQVLGGDTAAILLLDADAIHLTVRAARGLEAAVERGIRVPVGKGFAGRIAAERRVVVLDDVDRAELVNPVLRERGVRSLLGAPLIMAVPLRRVLQVRRRAPH